MLVTEVHDLLLHVVLSDGMDIGLVMQSKQTYKVNRCLLPLPKSLCVFRGKKGPDINKNKYPGTPASQNTSVAVSSKFCMQNSFKAAEMVQPHRLLQPRPQISITFLHCTETGQQLMQLTLPEFDHYPKFPRVVKIPTPPDNRKLSREHNANIPKW